MITGRLLFISLVSTVLLFPVDWVRSQTPAKTSVGTTLSVVDAGHWRTLQKGVALRTVALERGAVTHVGPSAALSNDLDLRRKVLWL